MSRVAVLLFTAGAVCISGCDGPTDSSAIAGESKTLDFVLPLETAIRDTELINASPAEPLPVAQSASIADMTPEEVFAMYPATIVEKYSLGSVTSNLADGYGHTKYIGTHGFMETEMQLYYLGSLVVT
jgi:hypothetical protein